MQSQMYDRISPLGVRQNHCGMTYVLWNGVPEQNNRKKVVWRQGVLVAVHWYYSAHLKRRVTQREKPGIACPMNTV